MKSTRKRNPHFAAIFRLPLLRLAVVLLAVLGLVNTRSSSTLASSGFAGTTKKMPTFSLFVTLQFTEQQYKDQFLDFFQPVAQHVKQNEPDTLAYEILLSDKDPLQVLILERYRDKENAYLKVHRSSAPFLEFRPKLKALQDAGHVSVSGHSYLDAGIGFGDRVALES